MGAREGALRLQHPVGRDGWYEWEGAGSGRRSREGNSRGRRRDGRHQRCHRSGRGGQRRLHRGTGPVARRPRRDAAPVLPEALPAVLRAGDQLPPDPLRPPPLQGLHPGHGGGRRRVGWRLRGDDPARPPLRDRRSLHRLQPLRRGVPRRAAQRLQLRARHHQGRLSPEPDGLSDEVRHRRRGLRGSGLLRLRRSLPDRRHRPPDGVEDGDGAGGLDRAGHRLEALRRQPVDDPRLRRAPRRGQQRAVRTAGSGGRADLWPDRPAERRPRGETGGVRAVRRLAST